MAVTLTPEQLKIFFLGQKHRGWQDTVDLYNKLKVHADGLTPDKLINERRPSESEDTMAYRQKIYVSKTKNPIGKVINSLSKIRRSPDWSIKYDEQAVPARIIEGETLQDYCEENYPGHYSLTNWAFSVLLRVLCIDANAVVAIFPLNLDAVSTNDYYKPMAMVFNSDQVIYYEEGAEYCILKSYERSSLTPFDINKQLAPGTVHYVITTTDFAKWEQDVNGGFQRTQYLFHGKNELPVFKVRAQFLKQKENTIIQESRIASMIPHLDEAAREYSDLQAAKVQGMFPLPWYYSNKECKTCNGTGKIADGKTSGGKECKTCQGTGTIRISPYAHIEINPPKLGEQTVPTPPAGFVQRDVAIIKLQEDSVKAHLFDALASINMQFLDQTPLNISGDAKNVDREELNNFVYSFAEDIVANMDLIYYWINEWRYSTIVPDKDARKAMLPELSVPQNFDLLPSQYLIEEITRGKNAKANSFIVAQMEKEYAVKKFYNEPEIAEYINLYYDLDPLQGIEVADKESLYLSKAVTQADLVISSYLPFFIKRAIEENENFNTLPLSKQVDIMVKYAKEKITENSAADQVKQTLMQKVAAAGNGGAAPNADPNLDNNPDAVPPAAAAA